MGPHETLIDNLAQGAVRRLRSDVAQTITNLRAHFAALLARAKTTGGKLEDVARNLELAAKLEVEYSAILRAAGYDGALGELLDTFESVAEANKGYIDEKLGRSYSSANLRSLSRIADGSVDRLLLRGQDAGARLRELLVTAAHTNAPVDETLRALADTAGISLRQAVVEAETQLMAFHREGLAVESYEAGIDLFDYTGPDDGIARPFCERFVGKIVTLQDLDDEENGESQPKPVSRFLGGYRCRHVLSPLALEEAQEMVEQSGVSIIGPGMTLARKILLKGKEGPAYSAWLRRERGSFVRGRVVRRSA